MSLKAVAELSVGPRSETVSFHGDIRSENADISNDKQCENHCRRKFKGFCARLIHAE